MLSLKKQQIQFGPGREIIVTVITMQDGDFMTVREVALLLNTTQENLRKHIGRHGIIVTKSNDAQIVQLKQQGVIPIKSARANLLSKDNIKDLVRYINTPEADAAYSQVWKDAQTLHSLTNFDQDIKSVEGIDYTMRALAELKQAIIRAEREAARADLEAAKFSHSSRSLCTSQGRNGSLTKKVKRLEDTIRDLKAEIGDSTHFKTIKAMNKYLGGILSGMNWSRLGRRLVSLSYQLEYTIKDVPDPVYGTIKAYHKKVWDHFLREVSSSANSYKS